jgi:site-specific recombinase XerD
MNYKGCKALADEEVNKLLEGMTGRHALRDRALFILGVFSGFRVSELLSVQVHDVYRDGRIVDALTVRRENMKGKWEARTMPLHRAAKEALAVYLRAEKLEHPFHANTALFFAQGKTTAMSAAHAWEIIQAAAARTGVSTERLGTHSMRKTFASRMWTSPRINGDLCKLQRLLGHANVNNTARYVEFASGLLEAAVLEA